MKSRLLIALGLMLIGAVSLAQEASQNKNGTQAMSAAAIPEVATGSAPASPMQTPNPEANPLTEQQKRGYAFGVQLGSDVAKQGMNLDAKFLLQGLADGLGGGKLLMSIGDINSVLAQMQNEQRDQLAKTLKDLGNKNKTDGDTFLAANKNKEGVVTLPSGLQYKILKTGDGEKPRPGDQVVCNYRATLIDGTEVDSSYKRHEPSIFPLKGVIKGWAEAMQLMPIGSKWQIVVPAELAYGERGSSSSSLIGPNTTMVLEVELLGINDPVAHDVRQ